MMFVKKNGGLGCAGVYKRLLYKFESNYKFESKRIPILAILYNKNLKDRNGSTYFWTILTTSTTLFTEREEICCRASSVTCIMQHRGRKPTILSSIPLGFAANILERGFEGRLSPQIEIDNVTDYV
jgi:hypothetical protein